MYILKNALKSITRAKVRTILIITITTIISISACIALSIRKSAETASETSLDSLDITANISVNRQALMKNAENGDSDKQKSLQGLQNLSLEDMQTYATSKYVSDFYYTLTSSLDGNDSLSPVDTSETNESTSTPPNGMPSNKEGGNRGFGKMGTQGDFTLVGYSSHDAMTDFKNGTKKVTEGAVFDIDSSTLQCIISDELAILNELNVGDNITLVNPNNEEETISLNICGIYNNSEASTSQHGNMMGFSPSSDPANQIYLSFNSLNSIIETSKSKATTSTDETTGIETSTALRSQESGTYVFSNIENYEAFKSDAVVLGLDDTLYTISSQDVNSYEQSMVPLSNLSNYSLYFLLVVLGIGGAILIIFNVFAVRERKYEIGVLAAIGMNKLKIATQFITEAFAVTFISIAISICIGATISVPIANTLLENQIASVESTNEATKDNFGGDFQGKMSGGRAPGAMTSPSKTPVNYIDNITASIDMVVLLQLLGLGILLTLISSATAVISILRYEPLKILSNRT